MKKCLSLLICLVIFSSLTNAQYSINKTQYDYRTYSYQLGDPYNPSVAGITSFLIPGLGQMLSGEGGRGAAFLGGYLGCMVVYIIGYSSAINDIDNGGTGSSGFGTMIVGSLGALGINIWSIVDAVRVAKVNNLAFRDQNKSSFNLQLNPYIDTRYVRTQGRPITGISLKYSF